MYVIGTAGHVDHGKSTLVKALTGINPDRWAEEQRREMTIDLGFAWRTLPSGRTVSLIDVPGHERFIKNMLAGIGGIDAALLVVAADESFMPQTEEHLAILDLLGVSHGLVVLTKVDLVDDEWLALVVEEVRERLHNTSLAHAPIVPVSARTGRGLDTLLAALDTLLDATPTRSRASGSPRLPIDRAFTIGGFGAVVTGTLIDGPLRVGDEVEILPQRLRGRVRGVQTHQQKSEVALPGSRVAVNLSGISHHEIARGNLLAYPGTRSPADRIDVRVRLTAGLAQNAALELFVGAAQTLCRATLLDREELAAGEQGWLQLRLVTPVAVARGDRYILRTPSPSRTIGGGVIVDTHPARHRRFRPEVLARLESLARGTPADLLRPALADNLPHTFAELLAASGLDEQLGREGLHALASEVITLGEGAARMVFISPTGLATLREKLAQALAGYHRRYPLRQGMPREDARSRLKISAAAFEALLFSSSDVVRTDERVVWLPDHSPQPDQTQARQVRNLLAEFAASPYAPPTPKIDAELLAYLVEQNQLVRVAEDVVFLAEPYAEMLAWVRDQIASGSLTVAAMRDRFRTSRKYALALLEHLDERKITRRVGDTREAY